MAAYDRKKHRTVDEDLFEEIDEEEWDDLVLQAQKEALIEEQRKKSNPKPKRPFPKWVFWVIAVTMAFQAISLISQTFSIPAIDFLRASAKLSTQEDIKAYKKAVVAIVANESRGTGFSISNEGLILTNYHVIEGEDTVTVAFPDDGFFKAKVVETYPSVDLAVLETGGENLPYLELAGQAVFGSDEPISFIGNPLGFQGIANEGTIIDYMKLKDWDEEVVMVKAPVYRGNSGSPVINKQGKVIGVVFATYYHEEHGKVGLFVPIDYFHLNFDKG